MAYRLKKNDKAMKKDSGNSKKRGKKGRKIPSCFMAYTLNNTQPVLCTLVSDQPFFYFSEPNQEHEITEEDLALFGIENMDDLEKDLLELKKKMEMSDQISSGFGSIQNRRMEEFIADAITISESSPALHSFKTPTLPEDLLAIVQKSRMGAALLEKAKEQGVCIETSPFVSGISYDRETGKILVHPTSLSGPHAVLLLVRELRRHWQYRQGALLHPLTFLPDQAILVNRAQVADLSVAMIRVAWELHLAGHREVWQYIEESPMADLGRAFAREAFFDFRSLLSGKASASVFESWFLSERCRYQDKKLIQAMLADHQGFVFSSEEASRTVGIELLSALGEEPYGKNYLAPYADLILSDALFNEVRDRSNANFLWFIKFERTFRETEHDLQETVDQEGCSTRSPRNGSSSLHKKVFKPVSEDIFDDDSPRASNVISLPGRSSAQTTHDYRQTGKGFPLPAESQGNVIHVTFGIPFRS